MVVVLLLLGAALRGVTEAAYWPALIFPDSVRYLQYAHYFTHGHWTVDDQRQSGYSILITPAVALNAIWLIPLVQHLAGLATAVLIYAVLIRLGARRWLAALATIPVLFDPLQLILEQYVLTDIWTVLLVMAALALLIARRYAVAGLLLGIAVTFRDEELIMIVPALIYAGRMWRKSLALAVCFLIPVTAYLGWFDATRGHWNFTTFSGAFLYGRVADFADCTGLSLPAYEKPLCPTQPPAQRIADFYTWNPASPQWTFTVPPGRSRDSVVQDFSMRILQHQPLAYAEAAAKDFLYGFSPVRGAVLGALLAVLPEVPPADPAGPAGGRLAQGDRHRLAGQQSGAGRLPGGLLVLYTRPAARRRARHRPGRGTDKTAQGGTAVQPQRDRGTDPGRRLRHVRLALPAPPAHLDPGRGRPRHHCSDCHCRYS